MRLLKTACSSPLELVEFVGQNPPQYAILSHTWEHDEVLFRDVQSNTSSTRAAFPKLCRALENARRDGFEYMWIDTCCIDKSSSAELSEAINSMFEWYGGAARCYAYLSDVTMDEDDDVSSMVEFRQPDHEVVMAPRLAKAFLQSRWFTRGWTLQELLAPPDLTFFANDWQRLGTRVELQRAVSEATAIENIYLVGSSHIDEASIAQRMSWAASRQTTRIEDMAYSLMGIFSINMPLLYGEGHQAFIRLQEEIMKYSNDQSIFAWADADMAANAAHSMLADRPAAFKDSGSSVPRTADCPTFVMTNRGLNIELALDRAPTEALLFIAFLRCYDSQDRDPLRSDKVTRDFVIYLRRSGTTTDEFVRVHCDRLVCADLATRSQPRRRAVFIQHRFARPSRALAKPRSETS